MTQARSNEYLLGQVSLAKESQTFTLTSSQTASCTKAPDYLCRSTTERSCDCLIIAQVSRQSSLTPA